MDLIALTQTGYALSQAEARVVPLAGQRVCWSKSGYKGVYFHKRRKVWLAECIGGNKNLMSVGYSTPEQAAWAYDKMAREIHGSDARVNFPLYGEELGVVVKKSRDFCAHGHPMTASNTIKRKSGVLRCRECKRFQDARRRLRLKSAEPA